MEKSQTISNLEKIWTFYALFEKIEQEFETCFIFESLGDEEKFSRYSIIEFDPEQIISAKGNNLVINGKNYTVKKSILCFKGNYA